jgi:acylglycerol lipase
MKEFYLQSKNGNINIIEGNEIEFNKMKAIILNVHGLGSHFQFIFDTIDEFNNRDNFFSKFNYKSYAFEFYGHGKSEGERCVINNFDNLLNDLDCVINYINDKYNMKKKIYLCCESMGGSVALKYVNSKKDNNIGGLILLSPMCGIDDTMKPSFISAKLLLLLGYIYPNLKLSFLTKNLNEEYMEIKDYVEAKKKCKYRYKDAHSLCTLSELYNISMWIPNNINNIDIPVILFHGTGDTITSPSDSKKLMDRIYNKKNELILLDTNEHTLLVPKNYDDMIPNMVCGKILEWLENILC